MTITLPWPPRELSPNWRGHWARKAAKVRAYRHCAYFIALGSLEKLSDVDTIEYTFIPKTNARRDRDNLLASMKSAQDGICQALGVDDLQITGYQINIAMADGNPRVVAKLTKR